MERQKPGHENALSPEQGQTKLAARVGDTNTHGGEIKTGDHEVLVACGPAAREGDVISCPKHGPGRVAQVSKTVMIGGAFAARQSDICACAEAPASAHDRPATAGPGTSTVVLYSSDPLQRSEKEQFEKSNVRGPLAQVIESGEGKEFSASALKVQFGAEEGNSLSVDTFGVNGSYSGTSSSVNFEGEAYTAQLKGNFVTDNFTGKGTVTLDDLEVKAGLGPTEGNSGLNARLDASACFAKGEGTLAASTGLGEAMRDYLGQFAQAAMSTGGGAALMHAMEVSNYLNIGVGVNDSICAGLDFGLAGYLMVNKETGQIKLGLKGELIGGVGISLTLGNSPPVSNHPKHPDNKVDSGSHTVHIGD